MKTDQPATPKITKKIKNQGKVNATAYFDLMFGDVRGQLEKISIKTK
jgi:hypothetical protein